jgi:hypothetical protein
MLKHRKDFKNVEEYIAYLEGYVHGTLRLYKPRRVDIND